MISVDDATKENINEHNPNWSQIPDQPERILITGGSESGKTISLFNLISQQPDIDKICSYAKDEYGIKCQQLLINKRENTRLKHLDDSKAFIEYSNDMDDIYENIDEQNPNEKHKILNVSYDMIVEILSNKFLIQQ